MALNTHTIALISVGLGVVGMAWAIFWPVRAQPGAHPASAHWDMVHLDEDGVLQNTLVRVILIDADTGRMRAWCSRSGCERVFKLSSIVKATDVRTNARIDLARLTGGQPAAKADDGGGASVEGHQAGVATGRRRVDRDALFMHQHAQ